MRIQRGLVAVFVLGLAGGAIAQERPRDQRRPRQPAAEAPRVGQVAPAFKLEVLGTQTEVSLADFAGRKPVVLIFGSYT